MKPIPRKLGDPIPERLLLKPDGTLAMADGSDPAVYLKAVRRMWKSRGTVPICINNIPNQESVEFRALLQLGHSA